MGKSKYGVIQVKVCDFLTKRWNTDLYTSIYFEAEWWDKLLPFCATENIDLQMTLSPHSSPYYRNVANFINENIPDIGKTICDVGCGAGRFIYEFDKCYDKHFLIDAVEPSSKMCQFIYSLLIKNEKIEYIPIINTPDSFIRIPVIIDSFNDFKIRSSLFLHNIPFEELKTPYKYDCIFCLNVIDRHPQPLRLINQLQQRVSPNGYLCIATPFDWQEKFTEKENWIDDLKPLFNERWQIIAEKDFYYAFRFHSRKEVSFNSSLIILQLNN